MRARRAQRATAVVVAALALLAAACTGDDGTEEGSSPTTAPEEVGTDAEGYEATIRRTTGGVPHITAADVRSLSFGQGWASGEDRTCDLADQVVKIRGERARWFGAGEEDENLRSDVAWLALGVHQRAVEQWDDAPAEVRELLEAFADGWNAQLAEVGVDGIDDWCAGEPWVQPVEGVDLYAYARAIALQASGGAIVDLIGTAAPPTAPAPSTEAGPETTTAPAEGRPAALALPRPVQASNGWAIGTERAAEGGGMLVANPHFPWEGELRFWEVHLTVPGEVDIYGVQLSGLPGIGIGFTEDFGWTHTVSAGTRFTAYRLDLVPGSPTSYVYGDEQRDMTSTDITVEVLGDDGELEEVTRTVWSSHYGPILDFPGFGWSDSATITYRDANIDNDEFIAQYLAMMQAGSLDELIDIHERINGVPLFNTIAVSADGRAWYADTSATPNLSDEAIAAYEETLATDPIVQIAAENQAVLLDGSDPLFEWVDEPGARDPGLVPFADQPAVEKADYVFNANDSFWLPHATEVLEDERYSPLHGRQRTARSPRTRENARVLSDETADGPAGDDGQFTLDELADAALWNRGYTSRALRAEVVERCEAEPSVAVDALVGEDGVEVLPAATVDVSEACDVLAAWDGVYDLDRAGPAVWREMMSRYEGSALAEAGDLWRDPFDPEAPVDTPAGLAPPADGGTDLALVNLARAVQVLEAAGIEPDATLGEVQVSDRNGTLVPIHGGDGRDGTTNIVGFGSSYSILDPELTGREAERLVPGSSLRTIDGDTRWWVNNGSSFILALELDPDGPPRAKALLTYGNTADRSSPLFVEATERFSDKAWRDVPWTEAEIKADPEMTEITVRG